MDKIVLKIWDLLQNENYKKKALEVSLKMKKEDFKEEIYDFILT